MVVVAAGGRPTALFLGVLIANTGDRYHPGAAGETGARPGGAAGRAARRGWCGRAASGRCRSPKCVDGDLVVLAPGDQVLADGGVVESVGADARRVAADRRVGAGGAERGRARSCPGRSASRAPAPTWWTQTGEAATRPGCSARPASRPARSPLEVQINRLLRVLVGVHGAAGGGVRVGADPARPAVREAAGTATAGIVTLVPEGLMLLTSLTFAARRCGSRGTGMLVQYLNAVESLANVDTVCLDKTGTLTDGTLALHERDAPDGEHERSSERLAGFAAQRLPRTKRVEAIQRRAPAHRRGGTAEVPFSSRWKWSACAWRATTNGWCWALPVRCSTCALARGRDARGRGPARARVRRRTPALTRARRRRRPRARRHAAGGGGARGAAAARRRRDGRVPPQSRASAIKVHVGRLAR